MPEEQEMPKQKKLRSRIAYALVFLIALSAAVWYLESASFQERVRKAVAAELEDTTGGKVELKSFHWNLPKLEFVADDLTIHGLEAPGQQPYAHLEHLQVRLKVFSWWQREFGLRLVVAQKPVVHIIVNANGTTNQPTPKISRSGGRSPVDELFRLAINRLESKDGLLIWNDRRIPLDFAAENVSAAMAYERFKHRYVGKITMGGSVLAYRQFHPLASNAELDFILTHSGAEITTLRWASPQSKFEAHGQVQDLLNPAVELTYHASLNLAELGVTARIAGLRSGRVEVDGAGRYAPKSFASSGRVTLKDLNWHDDNAKIQILNAASLFSVDDNKLTLSRVFAQTFGGTVSGEAEAVNWRNFEASSSEKSIQRGKATLKFNSIQAAALIASAGSKPLQKLNAQATVSGDAALTWRGSPVNAVADLNAELTPPAASAPGTMPIHGQIHGSYDIAKQQLQFPLLDLSTAATRIHASGAMGTEAAQLKLQVVTDNLKELEPVISSAIDSGRIPLEVAGRAAFDGTVSGRFKAPTVRGHLDLSDFHALLAVSGRQPDIKKIRWDALNADLDYSSQALAVQNGHLRRGGAQITFSGQTALTRGAWNESSQFSLRAELNNGDVTDVQSIAGTSYPVTGALYARGNVSGSLNNLSGEGNIRSEAGTLDGEPYKQLSSNVDFSGKEAHFHDVRLSQNGALVSGSLDYNLTSQVFRFQARGDNFNLSHLQKLQFAKLSVAGDAAFEATGSGTLEQPEINGKLKFTHLVLNGEPAGDIAAEATTHGRELQLKIESQLNSTQLEGNGTVQLTGDLPARLQLNFSHLDFDPALRAYMGTRVTGHSSASGNIVLTGAVKNPKQWQATGSVDEVSAQIEHVVLTNKEPIRFHLLNQAFTLERMHVQGEGTNLIASGTIELFGDHKLDVRANGATNLKLFQGFNRDLISSGTADLEMRVEGTLRQPELAGQVQIRDAGISFIDLPNGLSEINGTLVFNENRLRIQTLTAHTGGGTLKLGGSISYRKELFFDLTASGKDIRLRYPPGISSSANAELRYTGTTQNSLLSGDVLVTRFGINPHFDFALYLAKSKQPASAQAAMPILDNLRLDVHVTSTPELRVETSLAKVSGDADFRIRGSASRPAVLGRVNLIEGDVVFNGTKYQLESGDITFTNPVRVEPVLNLDASARVREYDISIGFHGSVDKLSTTYRSEPPLPPADIIALLALGRTREDTAFTIQTAPGITDTLSNAVLGQALDAAVSSRVQKLFGVSRIKIDPQVGGPENNPNARLTIEQAVNNNITLTYITNLSQSAQEIIQAEFSFNRNTSLVVVRDQNGVLGFDVRIRQRKK